MTVPVRASGALAIVGPGTDAREVRVLALRSR